MYRFTSGRIVQLAKYAKAHGWKRSRRKDPKRPLARPKVTYTRFSTGHTAKSLVEVEMVERRLQRIANTDVYP